MSDQGKGRRTKAELPAWGLWNEIMNVVPEIREGDPLTLQAGPQLVGESGRLEQGVLENGVGGRRSHPEEIQECLVVPDVMPFFVNQLNGIRVGRDDRTEDSLAPLQFLDGLLLRGDIPAQCDEPPARSIRFEEGDLEDIENPGLSLRIG